jgi:hypothetical protein
MAQKWRCLLMVRVEVFTHGVRGETRSSRACALGPRKALHGGISKSILQRPCQFLTMNAHKMTPRTT